MDRRESHLEDMMRQPIDLGESLVSVYTIDIFPKLPITFLFLNPVDTFQEPTVEQPCDRYQDPICKGFFLWFL